MPSCSGLMTAFLLAIAFAVAGQAVALMAWRQRRPEISWWHWLSNPGSLYRASYYQQPTLGLRYLAVGFQAAGALTLAWLAFQLLSAQRSGLTAVCGFSF